MGATGESDTHRDQKEYAREEASIAEPPVFPPRGIKISEIRSIDSVYAICLQIESSVMGENVLFQRLRTLLDKKRWWFLKGTE